jgi:hypothetical protein
MKSLTDLEKLFSGIVIGIRPAFGMLNGKRVQTEYNTITIETKNGIKSYNERILIKL